MCASDEFNWHPFFYEALQKKKELAPIISRRIALNLSDEKLFWKKSCVAWHLGYKDLKFHESINKNERSRRV